MRSDTEAIVMPAMPVTKIVTRLFAASCKVADLILRESGTLKSLHHLDIETGNDLFVRKNDETVVHSTLQCRVFIEVEHVDGEMADTAADGFLDRSAKRIGSLIGKAEN